MPQEPKPIHRYTEFSAIVSLGRCFDCLRMTVNGFCAHIQDAIPFELGASLAGGAAASEEVE